MRVVMLTQYYPPETGAPQNRLSDLARRLVDGGDEVTVLTAMPNYPAGRVQEPYRGSFWASEEHDGARVLRAWIYATPSRRLIPWALHYISFVFTSFLTGLLRLRRADVLITESPPLFLGISGWLLARLKGAQFVFNVADLWPEAGIELGVVRSTTQIRALLALEAFLYRRADLVSAQTRGIAESIRSRFPQVPVHLLTNGADLDRFAPGEPDQALAAELGIGDEFVVGYAGLHGPAQALEGLVDAAGLLRDEPEILVLLIGTGPTKPELQRRAADAGLTNVRFLPLQPRERMPGILRLWDVGVVSLYDGELMRGALPSKMFEYMSAGLPLVLSAPEGEASAVVNAAGCGFHVAAEDPEAIADAVRRLHHDDEGRRTRGRNARAHVGEHFSRSAIARAFRAELAVLSGDGVGGDSRGERGPPGDAVAVADGDERA